MSACAAFLSLAYVTTIARGRTMPDVADTSPRALDALPAAERAYTGSDGRPRRWPYDDPPAGVAP